MNKEFYDNLEKLDKAMADWKQAKDDIQRAKEKVFQFAQYRQWSFVREAVNEAENAEQRQREMLDCMVKYSARMVKATEEVNND